MAPRSAIPRCWPFVSPLPPRSLSALTQRLTDGSPSHATPSQWWGNTVYKSTADAQETPFKNLTEGQTFGDKTWT